MGCVKKGVDLDNISDPLTFQGTFQEDDCQEIIHQKYIRELDISEFLSMCINQGFLLPAMMEYIVAEKCTEKNLEKPSI